MAALTRLGARARRRLASLHCPGALAPARGEDGGRALSEAVGEHGEALEEVMLQSGWSAKGVATWKDEVWRLLRVWDTNKLSFQGPSGTEQCVFPTISRMNHSCEPNVRLIPSGTGELVALAAVDIAKGEELCICYLERNALPLLHFLLLPSERRRHLLRRWGFECGCPRCAAPEDGARAFCCRTAGCQGQLLARGAGLGACGECGREAEEAAAAGLLEAEASLWREAESQLAPLLKAAVRPEEFPMAEVLGLLGRCGEAGLARGHWLAFWLLCLAGVGGGGRDLGAAALGVARAAALPASPGALPALAPKAPPAARELLAAADAEPPARRPGITPRLVLYFGLG